MFLLAQFEGLIKSCGELQVVFIFNGKFTFFKACNLNFRERLRKILLAKSMKQIFINPLAS